MAVYTGVVLVAVLLASGGVGGIWLTFRPSTIVEGTTSTLTIRCGVSATSHVYVIKMFKGKIRLALVDESERKIFDPAFQDRASGTFSLDPPTSAYLTVILTGVSCLDGGEYSCEYSERFRGGVPSAKQSLPVRAWAIRLTFTPSTIVEGITSTLTIRCDVSATSHVYVIKMFKGKNRLALVDEDRRKLFDPALQHRLNGTGSVYPPSSAYVSVTLTGVSRLDGGEYSCEYVEKYGVEFLSTKQSLEVSTQPGPIQISIRPLSVSYEVNDEVELECTGKVGTPVSDAWKWEINNFVKNSSWTPIPSNIQQTNTGFRVYQLNGRSRLRFRVQQEDDNHMYRCSDRSGKYSASYVFRLTPKAT